MVQTADLSYWRRYGIIIAGFLLAMGGIWFFWPYASPGLTVERSQRIKDREITALCLTPDGKTLITNGGEDGRIELLSFPEGRPVGTLGSASDVASLSLTPDGGTLFSGGSDGKVRMWDLRTGKETDTVEIGPTGILALSWNDPHSLLAMGCIDGTVRLWWPKEASAVKTLITLEGWVDSLSFSADGKYLAFGDSKPLAHVWNVERGTKWIDNFGGGRGRTSVSFGGGPSTLAISINVIEGSNADGIELWDVSKEMRLGSLIGSRHAESSKLLASSDGELLVAANHHLLTICDLKHNKCSRPIEGHSAKITAMAFSPDGTRVVTACQDSGLDDRSGHAELKIWRVKR